MAGAYSLTSTPNDRFLRNFFMAISEFLPEICKLQSNELFSNQFILCYSVLQIDFFCGMSSVNHSTVLLKPNVVDVEAKIGG